MNPDRLAVVRQCVAELWATRADGRWSAMEDALTDILNGAPTAGRGHKKPSPRNDTFSQASPTPAGDNVILLWTPARVARRRRKS